MAEIQVKNDLASQSIEELEEIKKYMKEHGLQAFALDLEYAIADRIMEDIDNGIATSSEESSTASIFEKAKKTVQDRHAHN